jgi:branched-chain amino acid aminotransferase
MANHVTQIKYEELSSFCEVMAAGTAAALVPIRSITRNSSSETSTYIKEDSEEPGPICLQLLTTLKGIQQGKVKDTFGWCSKVEYADVTKFLVGQATNGGINGPSVDQLP